MRFKCEQYHHLNYKFISIIWLTVILRSFWINLSVRFAATASLHCTANAANHLRLFVQVRNDLSAYKGLHVSYSFPRVVLTFSSRFPVIFSFRKQKCNITSLFFWRAIFQSTRHFENIVNKRYKLTKQLFKCFDRNTNQYFWSL